MGKKPVPLIPFVGVLNSGKTTFIEKLVPVLKQRGLCIAIIKDIERELSPHEIATRYIEVIENVAPQR